MVFEDTTLPDTLPIFPLGGALLLPGGQLPLHIFEPRYVDMICDALSADRLIGMIQPRPQDTGGAYGENALYAVGCAGKIRSFEEMDDGRFYITLHGISRFKVARELNAPSKYRRIQADWNGFENDKKQTSCLDLDRDKLNKMLSHYFAVQNMSCEWEAVEQASDHKLITCLSMICPFSDSEKQALLEADCCKSRADLFMAMIEMACLDRVDEDKPPSGHH